MRRWPWLALLLSTVAILPARGQEPTPAPAATSAPQDTALERKVREVGSMLRCPVCLNLSIYDSPSEMARDMLQVVRDKLKAGETKEQIFAYYIQRYGDWVLMAPPARGVSLLVWLLPALVVVGGGALIVLAVQRWTRRPAEAIAGAPSEQISEEDLKRVRAELAKGQDDRD